MYAQINGSHKKFGIKRTFVIGAIILLVILITSGFVWIHTDQVIVPPGVMIMDWLWRAYSSSNEFEVNQMPGELKFVSGGKTLGDRFAIYHPETTQIGKSYPAICSRLPLPNVDYF